MSQVLFNIDKASIRNCLNDVDIRDERRCGNSTRQIDKAIQILHEDGIVHILDHFQGGTNTHFNINLLDRVATILVANKLSHSFKPIEIDIQQLIIRFKR